MDTLVSQLGAWKDAERYDIRGNLAEIKKAISSEYDLSDYKQKRRFYKELSAENHLVWRAIKTFEDARETFPKTISEAAITAMYNDITINPTDADILNANALMMAYEYLFRLQQVEKTNHQQEFFEWIQRLERLGQDLKIAHKPDQLPTLTPVPLYDVLRYARYIAMHLKMDDNVKVALQNLLLTAEAKVKLSSSSKKDPCKPSPKYEDPLTSQKILTPDADKTVQVVIDNTKERTLPLYPYDTVGTIQRRLAVDLELPLTFVRFREAIDTVQENIIIKQFGKTTITFHDVDWKYNPNESKKLYFDTAIGEVSKVVLTNQDTNVILEIDDYFDLLESENRKSICPRNMFPMFALLLLLQANSKKCRTIGDVKDALKQLDTFSQFRRKLSALKGHFTKYESKPANALVMDVIFFAQMARQMEENNKRLKIFSHYMEKEQSSKRISIADLKQTDYRISGTFLLPRTDIYQLFNSMPIHKNIPFARAGKFVKAINNILVPASWTDTIEDTNDCSFYIAITDNPTVYKQDHKQYFAMPEEFVKCTLQEVSTKGSFTTFSFEIITSDEEVEPLVLYTFVEALQQAPSMIKARKTFAGGITIVNKLECSFYMLHDFTLNNAFVSDTIRINERSNIYKLKQTVTDAQGQKEMSTSTKMRISLSKDSSVFVDATLSKMIPESPKSPERYYFHVPSNTEVWSLELKGALSTEQVKTLLKKFLIAMEISTVSSSKDTFFIPWYCHQTQDINSFIQQSIFKVSLGENYILNAPDLFVSNYKRRCENRPTAFPYSQEKYMIAKRTGKEQGRTPRLFPNDGSPKYILTCPYPDKKHVGLILNTTLSNRDMYPYIPCCYQDEHKLAKTYFSEDKPITFPAFAVEVEKAAATKTTTKVSYVGSTKALFKENSYGELVPRFQKLFGILDDSIIDNKSVLTQDFLFLRKGCGGDINTSALKCLVHATGKQITPEKLANFILQSGCTEGAGLTSKAAVEILRTGGFIDVRSFYQALRHIFEVEILICMQDRELNPEGILACEYFERVRIVNIKDKQYPTTVILNVHKGAEYDNLEVYITELVVKVSSSVEEIQRQFATSSHFIQQCMDIINQYYPTQYVGFDTKDKMIQKQQYDSFGKTRGVHIPTDESLVHVYMTPIPNIVCKDQQSMEQTEHLLSYEKAKQVWPESQVVVYKPRKEVIGIYRFKDEVGAYMPIAPQAYVSSMGEPYNTDLYSYPIPVSYYDQNFTDRYSHYVRMSNFIKSYMLWLFSRAIYEQKIEDAESYVDTWVKEYILIESSTHYTNGMVERAFSENNTTIVKDKKYLILRNLEGSSLRECEMIKERLLYILKQCVKFQDTYVYDFREENYIPNYYSNSFAFYTSPNFTVYNSVNEYRLMVEGSKSTYYVKYKFENCMESYYVKHNEDVYLVCRAKNFSHAIGIQVEYAVKGTIWTDKEVDISPEDVSMFVGTLHGLEMEHSSDTTDFAVGRLDDIYFAMIKAY